MKYTFIMKKILAILVLIFACFKANAAINLEDFGDFSSRSVIISGMQNQNKLSQEMKDLLEQKKLALNSACLISQIKKKNIENVAILLNAGINPNISENAQYPIYVAAKENNFEMVKMLYDKGAKLDKGFYSELYEALKNKNHEMAQYLLDRNANISYRDAITTNSILYMAIKNNMLDIAKQVAKKGVFVDRKASYLLAKKKIKLLDEE